MKIFGFFYSIIVGLLLIIAGFVAVNFHKAILPEAKLSFSPLPSSFILTANAQVTTLDFWIPKQSVLGQQTMQPEITAKSGLAYDVTTNQVLFEKNIQEKLPMASLTKIMTAIVALEHKKSYDNYLVTSESLVGEDSMGLTEGETLTLKELLYGLFLHSGNDAAVTMALNFPGGVKEFTDAMNQKAKALGLKNTHFTNPSGLEGDGNQYTTVYDLLVMTKYGLQHFADFGEVAATVEHIISQTGTHKEYDLINETNLLTSYPGVKGIKTGFTPEAGLCLVTYLDYENHHIIGVILGSTNRKGDMKEILDYSLKKLGITPPIHE